VGTFYSMVSFSIYVHGLAESDIAANGFGCESVESF